MPRRATASALAAALFAQPALAAPPRSPRPFSEVGLEERHRLGAVEVLISSAYEAVTLGVLFVHLGREAQGIDSEPWLWTEFWMFWGHIPSLMTGVWGHGLLHDDMSETGRIAGSAMGFLQGSIFSGAVAGLVMASRDLYFDRNHCHIEDPRGCIDNPYGPAAQGIATGFGITSFVTGALALSLGAVASGLGKGLRPPPHLRSAQVQVLPYAGPDGGGAALSLRF